MCIHTVQVSFFPVQFPSWLSHVQLDCWRFEVGSDHKTLPDGDKNTVKNTMVVPNRVNTRIGGEEFSSVIYNVIDLILNHTFCSQYVVSIMKHLHIRRLMRGGLSNKRVQSDGRLGESCWFIPHGLVHPSSGISRVNPC